ISEAEPFDFEKSKRLSVEKRQQYDLVFFNELEVWDKNSNRYGAQSPIKRRAEFLEMARDGYLPAYSAIRLLGIWPAAERTDPDALAMLIKSAEAGDVSAECAVALIPVTRRNWGDRDSVRIRLNLVREGLQKQHGACQAVYGSWLLLGSLP